MRRTHVRMGACAIAFLVASVLISTSAAADHTATQSAFSPTAADRGAIATPPSQHRAELGRKGPGHTQRATSPAASSRQGVAFGLPRCSSGVKDARSGVRFTASATRPRAPPQF